MKRFDKNELNRGLWGINDKIKPWSWSWPWFWSWFWRWPWYTLDSYLRNEKELNEEL